MKTKTTTSDIYFAASLLSLGGKIDNIDRTDPRHMRFTVILEPTTYQFQSSNLPAVEKEDGVSVIEQVENLWDTGRLQVNAVAFKLSFQKMQSLIHS